MTIETYGNKDNIDGFEITVAKKVGSLKDVKQKLWLITTREVDTSETCVILTKQEMKKLQKYINTQLK